MAPQPQTTGWLKEHGPGALERLLRAIMFNLFAPVLVADNDRRYLEASAGAGRLLGLPRESIIGRSLDDFAEPGFRPVLSERWVDFLRDGVQEGTLRLATPAGPREFDYVARENILPLRHLVVLKDKALKDKANGVPTVVEDYALFLLDVDGRVAAWYAGAERIYGFMSYEAIGNGVPFFDRAEGAAAGLRAAEPREKLKKAADAGHSGVEGWQVKRDGTRFWANVIMMALKDEHGDLQGFAVAARDFTSRRERDEKLRRSREQLRPLTWQSSIAWFISGEEERIPETSDSFLELAGYSREDLRTGALDWSDLTPPEYIPMVELAHEEGLRSGACTTFENELIRKDGTRVTVLVATALLKLSPYRWITFVQDLRSQEPLESVDDEDEGAEVRQDEIEDMVGGSAALKRVRRLVEVVAPTDATVLIMGETGTGKELIARAIHRMSARRNLPFITLNCAAIPTGLLESELFGYEKGAFTGALSQKIGRFEMADKGTLFLDEVGDIPLDLQPKLLRALQEKVVERLGGTKTIDIDIRLVAATNRDLTRMMGDKLFRSDLYYRLKVFPIVTPPLRDRPDDIPELARYFTKKYAARMGRQIHTIPEDTMRALAAWRWPGNVRELENFIERAVILSKGCVLRAPIAEIRKESAETGDSITLEQVGREHIVRVLRDCGGVVSTAATRLGLHRTTLNSMMRKLGISRRDV
jgi:formate hydrogenlyase transcriptional activator